MAHFFNYLFINYMEFTIYLKSQNIKKHFKLLMHYILKLFKHYFLNHSKHQ